MSGYRLRLSIFRIVKDIVLRAVSCDFEFGNLANPGDIFGGK